MAKPEFSSAQIETAKIWRENLIGALRPLAQEARAGGSEVALNYGELLAGVRNTKNTWTCCAGMPSRPAGYVEEMLKILQV